MDFLKQLMPTGAAGQDAAGAAGGQQNGAGLLADWQAYSGDVEAGSSGAAGGAASSPAGVAGAKIAKTAEEVGSSITSMFRSGYTAVSDGLGTLPTTNPLENT